MSILLGYADDRFEQDLEDYTVSMDMKGLEKSYDVKMYILDKDHANAYKKYCDLGKPDNPTEEQKQQIREFACLAPINYGKVSLENSQITFTMTNNATVLIELLPCAE